MDEIALPPNASWLRTEGQRLGLCVRDVLGDEERANLVSAIEKASYKFVDGSVGGARENVRRCSVLYTPYGCRAPVDEADPLLDQVLAWCAIAASAWGLLQAEPPRLECQISWYKHGDFYGGHRDDEGEEAAGRGLTYVYYLLPNPSEVSGGELSLFDDAGARLGIEPVDNRLVVFPSRMLHEVATTRAHDTDPMRGRLTVNGWWRART